MSSVSRRYYERGMQFLSSGDVQQAVEQLQAAVDLTPNYGNARIAFAVALAKFGDCPRAASVLRTGIPRATSATTAAAMHATLGDVLTLGGDFFGAEEAFKIAGATPGFEARAASGLVRVYAKLGRYPDSIRALRYASSLAK